MSSKAKILLFNKEPGGAWYVDLPNYPGPKSDLLMVSGADTLLDILANGNERILIKAELTEFKNSDVLELVRKGDAEGGGYYFIKNFKSKSLNFELWLCDVVKYVYGKVPERIFIAISED